MFLRNRPKNPKTMIRIGSVCLLVFFALPRLVPMIVSIGPDAIDLARGVMLGAAMGLILWAARLNARQRQN